MAKANTQEEIVSTAKTLPQGTATRIVEAEGMRPEDSPSSSARAQVARSAVQRQRENKPPRPLSKFLVSVMDSDEKPAEIDAFDENDAWAKFCDKTGLTVSPSRRVVKPV